MRHIQGTDRNQTVLFPDSLDQYVSDENPARMIDAFVDGLDLLKLGFQKVQPKATGRPPYHPGDLLKLFLYGYLNRIRSGRALERECHRNVELMWLLKRLQPDFKTLADFRRNNAPALKASFRELVDLCRRLNLVGGQMLALDGSVFRAVNSKDRVLSRSKLEAQHSKLDQDIGDYLSELERNDALEEERLKDHPPPDAQKIKQIIEQLRKGKLKLDQQLQQIEPEEEHVCTTDTDARLIRRRGRATCVGYNTQLITDEQHKLCVHYEVTCSPTDKEQLAPMTIEAMDVLNLSEATVLVDGGYFNGLQLQQAARRGACVYMPITNTSKNKGRGRHEKTAFHYDAATDRYLCPQGQLMKPVYIRPYGGGERTTYRTAACRHCSDRPNCTQDRKGRAIHRMNYEPDLEALKQRIEQRPNMLAKRKVLVEHPFGTLKCNWGYDHFLVKGKTQVNGEMALMLMAYNLKRISTLFGAAAQTRVRVS